MAVHGVFALALGALAVSDARSEGDAPLTEIPVVIMPDEPWTLSLAPDARSSTAATVAEPEPSLIRVEPVPNSARPSAVNDVSMLSIFAPLCSDVKAGANTEGYGEVTGQLSPAYSKAL